MTTVQRMPRVKSGAWSWSRAVELGAAFCLFAGVMHFLHTGPMGTADEDIGLPGHDSYYHVKMAALMPEIGLVDTFPWLRTTVFNDQFVNHHYGFQLLMSPFVHLAHRLTGDYAPGARWFITVSFGLSMALFQLLLMIRGVRHRWFWMGLCILLPAQFYGRHLFIRAINPSLVCMLLLCLCMFTRRYLATAVVVCLSIHIYLGSTIFALLLGGAVVLADFIGWIGDRRGADRRMPLPEPSRRSYGWKVAAAVAAGWLVGLITHPYGPIDCLTFLKLQVFGTGLTPDIAVGREWQSYSPAWYFANMSGIVLTATAIALCLRMRFGKRLDTIELALLLINFVFFALTLRARRFIEYWPIFSLLCSAYLVGPLFRPSRPPVTMHTGESDDRVGWGGVAVAGLAAVGIWWTAVKTAPMFIPDNFAAEWRLWTLLAGAAALAPIARACTVTCPASATRTDRSRSIGLAVLAGGVFCLLLAIGLPALASSNALASRRTEVGLPWFLALLAAYGLCAAIILNERQHRRPPIVPPYQGGKGGRVGVTTEPVIVILIALAFVGALVVPAGAVLGAIQTTSRSTYDLAEIRAVMSILEDESEEAAVIFTDDWDVFPVYFYYNHRNHYIVGLDPKFTHAKDPELWERFVCISRGQSPATRTVKATQDGRPTTRRIEVKLTDIRDAFGAEFVIVDAGHRALARQLERATHFAERLYPPPDTPINRRLYTLFRVLPRKAVESRAHSED